MVDSRAAWPNQSYPLPSLYERNATRAMMQAGRGGWEGSHTDRAVRACLPRFLLLADDAGCSSTFSHAATLPPHHAACRDPTLVGELHNRSPRLMHRFSIQPHQSPAHLSLDRVPVCARLLLPSASAVHVLTFDSLPTSAAPFLPHP